MGDLRNCVEKQWDTEEKSVKTYRVSPLYIDVIQE